MTTDVADPAYDEIGTLGAAPLWRYYGNLFPPQPRSRAVPHRWSYDALRPYMLHFAETLSLQEAERRGLMLGHPRPPDPPAPPHSLFPGPPIILPGATPPRPPHPARAVPVALAGR